jgi:hypothetical protein
VPGEEHRGLLGHPGVDQIADRRAPEVVEQAARCWDARGSLYFAKLDGRIWKVCAEGGLAAVTTPRETEWAHVLPWPLPGEQTLLYTVRKRQWSVLGRCLPPLCNFWDPTFGGGYPRGKQVDRPGGIWKSDFPSRRRARGRRAAALRAPHWVAGS